MAMVQSDDILAKFRSGITIYISDSDEESNSNNVGARVSGPSLTRVEGPLKSTEKQRAALVKPKDWNEEDSKPQHLIAGNGVRAPKRSAREAFGSPAQTEGRVRVSVSHSPSVDSQIRSRSSSSLSTAISITTSDVRPRTPEPIVISDAKSPALNDFNSSQASDLPQTRSLIDLFGSPITPNPRALQGLSVARALAQASIIPRADKSTPKALDQDVQALVNKINYRPSSAGTPFKGSSTISITAGGLLGELGLSTVDNGHAVVPAASNHSNSTTKRVTFLDGSLDLALPALFPAVATELPAVPASTQNAATKVRDPATTPTISDNSPTPAVLTRPSDPTPSAELTAKPATHPDSGLQRASSGRFVSKSALPTSTSPPVSQPQAATSARQSRAVSGPGPIFHRSNLPEMKGRPFTVAEKVCVIYLKNVLKLSWADIDLRMGRGHNCTATIYVRNVIGLKEPEVQRKLGYAVGKIALDQAFQSDITMQQALAVAETAMSGRPLPVPSSSQSRAQTAVPQPRASVQHTSAATTTGRTLVRHSCIDRSNSSQASVSTSTAAQEAIPRRRRGRPRKDASQVIPVVPDIEPPYGEQSRPRRSATHVDYRVAIRLSATPDNESNSVSSTAFDSDQTRRALRPIVRQPLSQVVFDRSIKSTSGTLVNDYLGSYRQTLRWSGASSDINTIAWAADGDYFAAGAIVDDIAQKHPTNFLRGRVSDGHLTHQAQSLGMPKASRSLSDVVFLPNSNHLITGGYDGVVRLYGNEGYEANIHCGPVSIYDVRCQVNLVAANVCDAVIAIGCRRDEDSVILTQITENLELAGDCGLSYQSEKALQQPLRQVFPTSLRWGPCSKSYYLAGGFAAHNGEVRHYGELCLWDCEHQAHALKYRTGGMIMDIKWTADGNYLAFAREVQNAARKGSRSQIDILTLNTLRTHGLNLECPADDIVEIVLCPYDTNIVAASTADGNAYIWDVRNANSILHTLSHGQSDIDYQEYDRKEPVGVGFLAWADEYASLYSGGHDGVVTSWDIRRAPGDVCTRNTRVSPAGIYCGEFNNDYSSLLLGEIGGSIAVLERSVEGFGRKSAERFRADKLPDIGMEPQKMLEAPEGDLEILPDPIEFRVVSDHGNRASFRQVKMGDRHRRSAFFRKDEDESGRFPPVEVEDDWTKRIPDAIVDGSSSNPSEAFACLRCGTSASINVNSRLVDCDRCQLQWQGGVLGYDRIKNSMRMDVDRPATSSPAPKPEVDGELAYYTSLFEFTQ